MTTPIDASDDIADLARKAMEEKTEEVGTDDETRVRELWDLPSESSAELAEDQARQG